MFAGHDQEMSVLALQLFLIGLSIPILLLGAMVEEVRHAGQMTRTLGASLMHAQDEERRRNARDLDREATLEEAQRIAHLGYWDHDLHTGLRTWSDETYRILGLAPQERTITSAVWQDLVHPEDRRMVNETLAEALGGGPRYDVDYRMVRPDGAVRVVHCKGEVTRDESNRPCRIFGTVQDITERKRAEEDLRESERRYRETQMELAHANRVATVGQLSAAIAHELNQPLGAILSNIEAAELMLGSPTPNLEELKTILADVRRADLRASEIIDRLRRLLTKSDFDAREIDLNEIAREVLGIMAVQAVERDVTLISELAPLPLMVKGDRVQFEQVILNLVTNAIEALAGTSQSNRQVTVRTTDLSDDSVAELTVSDSGPGILPESVHQVFEPFFTTKNRGMGMGLAIVHTIIEAHGGQIRAENQAGGGAIFSVSLPVIALKHFG
jgi:PAS domain S-box-containing protein